MAPPEIREVILKILERIAPDEDLSSLEDAQPFRELMELSKQYRVQIPEEDYNHLNTIQSTVGYLTPILKDVPSAV